jgi:heat shock protein HslJ
LTFGEAAAHIPPAETGKVGVMTGWTQCLGVAVCVFAAVSGAALADQGFPFDSEFLLDVRPMPGSKRIPNMDVAANGTIALEMWCNRVEGQVIVAGDTITVLTGEPTSRPCPPERARGDEELLGALAAVTSWRRQGGTVLLIGPRTLRFRVPTN